MMFIFSLCCLFSFSYTLSSSEPIIFFEKNPLTQSAETIYFYSQKVKESKKIRVWRYIIPRKDLTLLDSFSKLGLYTEDDVVVFLQYLLIQLKQQNAQKNIIKEMGINLLLSYENFFKDYITTNENSLCGDCFVVDAYEYVVYKKEKNIDAKINVFCKNISSNSLLFKYLRYIGEISVLFFKDKAVQFSHLQSKILKVGSIIILEEKNCYKIYYINSIPRAVKPKLVAKNEIKDLFLSIINNSIDVDASDIEN